MTGEILKQDIINELKKYLPNCNYIIINLEEYIDKEKSVYD